MAKLEFDFAVLLCVALAVKATSSTSANQRQRRGPSYSSLGCYRDTGNRAIPTLEGQDLLLDGAYQSRQNAIYKCYQAALKRGYRVFAVQNGGWCASGPIAEQTYNKYGKSTSCHADGEGGPWANHVYSIKGGRKLPYTSVGCFRDTSNRAIPTLEGHDSLLDGAYQSRQDAVNKCYRAALMRGYKVFSVQNGGWCASGPLAELNYEWYGQSCACAADGEGGHWANQVYRIQDPQKLPYRSLGCFRDTGNRAIQTLEGRDPLLDGTYQSRQDAVNKCYRAALKRGYKVFAVQNGGWCASDVLAGQHYRWYGPSNACHPDGEGGPWANQVYRITGETHRNRASQA